MNTFDYFSYKHQRDEQALRTLIRSIFILKLHAQNRLNQNDLDLEDVQQSKTNIIEILEKLDANVRSLIDKNNQTDIDIVFASIAKRFVDRNPKDVLDRLDEIYRLRIVLTQNKELKPRHFQPLDTLQSLLEDEISETIQGLYRF